jgi:hypothetical protein
MLSARQAYAWTETLLDALVDKSDLNATEVAIIARHRITGRDSYRDDTSTRGNILASAEVQAMIAQFVDKPVIGRTD